MTDESLAARIQKMIGSTCIAFVLTARLEVGLADAASLGIAALTLRPVRVTVASCGRQFLDRSVIKRTIEI